MSFYPELLGLELPALAERFHGPAPDSQEYAYPFYAEVASLIREQGKSGIDFLLGETERASTDQLRAILFALTRQPKMRHPALLNLLRSSLRDERPLIVAEAVDGLWSQGQKSMTYDVLELQHHSSPFVRGSVLRFVSHSAPRCAPLLLIAALKDSDPLVRENAVDELHRLGTTNAIPQLRPLLHDEDADVRQAARTAVEDLQWIVRERADNHKPLRAG